MWSILIARYTAISYVDKCPTFSVSRPCCRQAMEPVQSSKTSRMGGRRTPLIITGTALASTKHTARTARLFFWASGIAWRRLVVLPHGMLFGQTSLICFPGTLRYLMFLVLVRRRLTLQLPRAPQTVVFALHESPVDQSSRPWPGTDASRLHFHCSLPGLPL